ncbi:MAG: hypothetical protein L3V56_04825 [Candidatus Magnetoovum sp. WYHC-5]|nr:hypothetical protein [Candidatus Magnetoovum sp. WYHC-5]
MAWTLECKRDVLKFLGKQDNVIQYTIRSLLNLLLDNLKSGIVPFNIMDIKNLKGKMNGFMRLRVGNIRIIFKIDIELSKVKVYAINYRGDVYKH